MATMLLGPDLNLAKQDFSAFSRTVMTEVGLTVRLYLEEENVYDTCCR